METLKNDLVKIAQSSLELSSKVGTLQAPSWRFPERLAASVSIEEVLKRFPLSADSHVFLLELIIDRLLFLVQNIAEVLDSASPSQRTLAPALTLGSAAKKAVKCAIKTSAKTKSLKEELSVAQAKVRELQQHLTAVQSQKNSLENSEPDDKGDNWDTTTNTTSNFPTINVLPPAVPTNSCSTQTAETSFVICTRCHGTQQALMEIVGLLSSDCSKLNLKSELRAINWTEMVKMGDLDLAKWDCAFRRDMESLGKYRSRLEETINVLTSERDGLTEIVNSIESKNQLLQDKIISLQESMEEMKGRTEAAMAKRNEEFTKKVSNLTKSYADLEASDLDLRNKFAASREEVGSLSSALSSLKAHCKKVESELHQAENREGELENKKNSAEEQVSLLSEKVKMIHDILDHQQVELKKSKVYNESLEDKNKSLKKKQAALLSQLDDLDQECTRLREEVAGVRVQCQNLEEDLQNLGENHQQLQLQLEEKEIKLTGSQNLQKDLSVQLASLQRTLTNTEQQLHTEKSNCRLLMDFPYISKSDEDYSQHIASLVCKRLSQKQINANTIRIYMLEEQNNDLRYLNLKETIKEKTEDASSRQKSVTGFKQPIRLWQKSLTDELEKKWQEADVLNVPVGYSSDGTKRHSHYPKSTTYNTRSLSAEPKTWADKRSTSASLKGNLGNLMKAIDLHRVAFPDLGSLNPPTTTPISISTGSIKMGPAKMQNPRDMFRACENCDKICYEEPSNYCTNCNAPCRSDK